jgi:hypothetical protein
VSDPPGATMRRAGPPRGGAGLRHRAPLPRTGALPAPSADHPTPSDHSRPTMQRKRLAPESTRRSTGGKDLDDASGHVVSVPWLDEVCFLLIWDLSSSAVANTRQKSRRDPAEIVDKARLENVVLLVGCQGFELVDRPELVSHPGHPKPAGYPDSILRRRPSLPACDQVAPVCACPPRVLGGRPTGQKRSSPGSGSPSGFSCVVSFSPKDYLSTARSQRGEDVRAVTEREPAAVVLSLLYC